MFGVWIFNIGGLRLRLSTLELRSAALGNREGGIPTTQRSMETEFGREASLSGSSPATTASSSIKCESSEGIKCHDDTFGVQDDWEWGLENHNSSLRSRESLRRTRMASSSIKCNGSKNIKCYFDHTL